MLLSIGYKIYLHAWCFGRKLPFLFIAITISELNFCAHSDAVLETWVPWSMFLWKPTCYNYSPAIISLHLHGYIDIVQLMPLISNKCNRWVHGSFSFGWMPPTINQAWTSNMSLEQCHEGNEMVINNNAMGKSKKKTANCHFSNLTAT